MSKIIISDIDDVLVNISVPWVTKAIQKLNVTSLNDNLNLDSIEAFQKKIIKRKIPHIQDWLQQIGNLSQESYDEIVLTYRSDPTFYDDLQPTNMAKAILGSLQMPNYLNKLILISHNFDINDPCSESKVKWVERYFSEFNNVEFFNIDVTTKKTEVIKSTVPSPTLILEDMLSNVVSFLLDDEINPEEILIPRMGHNSIHDKTDDPETNELFKKIFELSLLRKIKINFYNKVL
jgi:hypothetical protein